MNYSSQDYICAYNELKAELKRNPTMCELASKMNVRRQMIDILKKQGTLTDFATKKEVLLNYKMEIYNRLYNMFNRPPTKSEIYNVLGHAQGKKLIQNPSVEISPNVQERVDFLIAIFNILHNRLGRKPIKREISSFLNMCDTSLFRYTPYMNVEFGSSKNIYENSMSVLDIELSEFEQNYINFFNNYNRVPTYEEFNKYLGDNIDESTFNYYMSMGYRFYNDIELYSYWRLNV